VGWWGWGGGWGGGDDGVGGAHKVRIICIKAWRTMGFFSRKDGLWSFFRAKSGLWGFFALDIIVTPLNQFFIFQELKKKPKKITTPAEI
jgi:hypothetical protein